MLDFAPMSTYPARVIANFGASAAIIDDKGSIKRAQPLKKLDLLVAGDKVLCTDESGSGETTTRVTQLQTRSTVLARPDRKRQLKPLAANVTRLLIVISPKPAPEPLLIDQFCIAAASAGIQPVIVLNKVDQIDSSASEVTAGDYTGLLDIYRQAGFPTALCSTKTPAGLDQLSELIRQQTSVLVGQSGVGKSSIVKKLLPDQEVRIGAISAATGIGAHTTTVSFWYQLEGGGALIDSPGVRQFAVDYLQTQQVESGFPEIQHWRDGCRFADCTHSVEPDCAVKSALDSGDISKSRYENFLRLSQAD